MNVSEPSNLTLIIALSILLAVLLDYLLMRALSRYWKSINPDNESVVFVFGKYSPLLSWLKKLVLRLRKQNLWDRTLQYRSRNNVELQAPAERESKRLSEERSIPIRVELWGTRVSFLILLAGVLIFCWPLFDLDSNLKLPGPESDVFQSIGLFFRQSLLIEHEFPLWNPYLRTGEPFVADPMLHVYNPVVALPILLFDFRIGYRLALLLSYLIAALGMWKLGRTLGFSQMVSVWMGLMYTFAGQPTIHFVQGQYLFIFGFAWLPWVFNNLFLYHQKRERRYLGYTALAIAGVHFSGNAYYSLYLGLIVPLLVLILCLDLSFKPFQCKVNWVKLRSYLLAGFLALGLVAIHLLPLLQFRPRMALSMEILGSHQPWQIWLDYTSRDSFRPDAYQAFPAREEFYAYIGYTPFIALILLPLAWRKGNRRIQSFFLLLFLMTVLWINVEQMPWRDLYSNTGFFLQFRHIMRFLLFGEIAILLLAAFGLDSFWRWILFSGNNHQLGLKEKDRLRQVLVILFGGFLLWGVIDLILTNSQYIYLEKYDLNVYKVTQWLKEKDDSEFFVRHNPVTDGHLAILSARLRNLDAWYHWIDVKFIDSMLNRRPVEARAHYVLQRKGENLPEETPVELYASFQDYNVYRLNESLPIAFSVAENLLRLESEMPLGRSDVTPQIPFYSSNRQVEIIAQGSPDQYLVLLVNNLPGWRVSVDNRPAELENVGGYLATRMQDGIHKYVFLYRPTTFYLGLGISLLSLAVVFVLIRQDIGLAVRRFAQWRFSIKAGWLALQKVKKTRFLTPIQPIFATCQEGVFYPEQPLADFTTSQIGLLAIEVPQERSNLKLAWLFWRKASAYLIQTLVGSLSLMGFLFLLSLVGYVGSRVVGLVDFPIYFFTDEAIQTVSAADLVRDNFYGPEKVFLPTYFQNGSYFNLSLSVYVQVIPYLLFGKSVFVTRFTSFLLSGLLILLLVGALRKTICPRAWWSLILFLAGTPTWFFHSRTAFETVLFTGLYAAFLGAYLLYLQRSPRYLYLTIIMAALAFYTYSPGQVVIALTALGLFAVDFHYHWKNRAYLARGMLLIGILLIPYLRFLSYHQGAPFQHLRNLDSYWFYDLPLREKILRYLKEYLMGLNPYYWFIPHSIDLNRHTMKGYGHLGLWNLPFITLGLIYALRQRRRPPYRVFLIAWLAVPSGAALVGVGITRLLAMVVPMAVFATLGWEWILTVFHRVRWQIIAQMILFVFLSGITIAMTGDSMRNGPTWYDDYGLYGMQYGTRQIFEQKIPEFLQRDPQIQLFVSSLWANGTDVFVRYFLTPQQAQRVSLGSIDSYLSRKQSLDDRLIFILTAEELRAALASPKMRFIGIEDEIHYPNGKIGFYIVRLAYVDNVDEIFAREFELRQQLMSAHLVVDGIPARVRYSQIDTGELGNLFDQKPETLMRGREANPFVLEFEFAEPQSLKGLQAQFGSMDFELVIYLYPQGQIQPIELHQEYRGLPPDPAIEFLFAEPMVLDRLRLEIRDLNYGEVANIHIRELKFLK